MKLYRLMLNILVVALLSGAVNAPAMAETAMSATDFDTYTRGKTLYYGAEGQRYGVEEYLPDRQVRWSFLDGHCKAGFWYEEAGLICFVYEDAPRPQCWSFFQQANGLSARFETGDSATEYYEIENDGEMLCLGPEVGV